MYGIIATHITGATVASAISITVIALMLFGIIGAMISWMLFGGFVFTLDSMTKKDSTNDANIKDTVDDNIIV